MSTDDLVGQPVDLITKQVKRRFTNQTHGIARKTVSNFRQKRSIKTHRKNIERIKNLSKVQMTNDIRNNLGLNFQKIDKKMVGNIKKLDKINQNKKPITQKRQDILNKNPKMATKLDSTTNQKETNRRKMRKHQNPLVSTSIGQRSKTQKVILAPSKAVSSAGASFKENFNEEIEASDDEGIKFVNDVISKSARSLRMDTNSVIAKKVGFDRQSYNLGKTEKKIMKSSKKEAVIKKAQRKNIRKKAQHSAKAITGKKSIIGKTQAIARSSFKQINRKIRLFIKETLRATGRAIMLFLSGGIIPIMLVFTVTFIPLLLVGAGVVVGGSAIQDEDDSTIELLEGFSLGEDVLQWEDKVMIELEKYGLEDYKYLALTIIHLESRGQLPDVMQSSESKGLAPNTITDPNESIEAGIAHLNKSVEYMKQYDVDIKTLIHSYNYGTGFIPYVAGRGGKWTQEIANEYSNYHAQRLGWNNYGDKQYVNKALAIVSIDSDAIELKADFDINGGKLAWPVPTHTHVNSAFGYRSDPHEGTRKLHTGIDIPAPTGTPVIAVADGVVTHSGSMGGYGQTIMIDHGSGIVTLYAHHSKLIVSQGDQVKAGTTIALIGSTGKSTGPHSHFEVRQNGNYTNPMEWLQ